MKNIYGNKSMQHSDIAVELFYKGYNCSQSVFAAFCDVMNIDMSYALRISQGLGGGVGRFRESCGAFTAAALVIGFLYGSDDPSHEAKCALYARVQDAMTLFKAKYGTFVCRELLGEPPAENPSMPQKRDADYYASRPCPEIIKYTAQLLDDYIKTH